MAHHAFVAAALRQRDRVESLGERADLVDLDEQRVGGAGLDAARQPLRVGDEQVVADDLNPLADRFGERLPAVPVLLVQRVLDGDQGVRRDQLGVVGGHLGGAALGALEGVRAVDVELGGGHVQGECDVPARGEAGLADRLQDQVQRLAVTRQRGGEAALVAEAGVEPPALQDGLEGVVGLGTPAQGLREGGRADRRDHELLDVDVGVGVRAAVDDVHHRHREQVRVGTAHVAEQRQPGRPRGRLGHREAHSEDGVGAETPLVVGPVQVDQGLVDDPLVGGVEADEALVDLLVDGLDPVQHALAAVALIAVAQLDGLELAGGGTAGDRGSGLGAVVEDDLDLDGRVATGVQDLPGEYGVDRRHG